MCVCVCVYVCVCVCVYVCVCVRVCAFFITQNISSIVFIFIFIFTTFRPYILQPSSNVASRTQEPPQNLELNP